MQRQVPGESRRGGVRQQRGRRQTVVDRPPWCLGLHHGTLAGAAAVARAVDTLTRRIAGTMSSISLTSSPMQCSVPWQHGQCSIAGPTATSSRGRCLGRLPMLRTGLGRIRPSCDRAFADSGSGSTGSVKTSLSPSASCPGSLSNRSDRAPYSVRRSVSSMARSLPFSLRSSSTISIRMSGSRAGQRRRTPWAKSTEPDGRFARFSTVPPTPYFGSTNQSDSRPQLGGWLRHRLATIPPPETNLADPVGPLMFR